MLLLGSRTSELFHHHPFVDEVIPIDRDQFRTQSKWETVRFLGRLLRRLRSEKFDAFLDLSLSREYAFAAKYWLQIPKRVGFDYHGRGLFLTDRLVIPEGYRWKHVIEYYLDLLEPIGLRAKTRDMEIFLDERELAAARELLSRAGLDVKEPFLVAAPGGGESWGKDAHFKRWPAPYFAEFLNQLKEEWPSRQVMLLGSEKEKELGKTIQGALDGFRTVNGMGLYSLRESLSLLNLASLVLTNDGFICHGARALNRPLIAFFGPVDPLVYGPYPRSPHALVIRRSDLECQPCYRSFRYNSGCPTIECLRALKPEDAVYQVRESGFLRKEPQFT